MFHLDPTTDLFNMRQEHSRVDHVHTMLDSNIDVRMKEYDARMAREMKITRWKDMTSEIETKVKAFRGQAAAAKEKTETLSKSGDTRKKLQKFQTTCTMNLNMNYDLIIVIGFVSVDRISVYEVYNVVW